MSKHEAILLLIQCRPLASKLISQGVNISTDKEDQKALKSFSRVWASGWLNNYRIYLLAGLGHNDIDFLTVKMVRDLTQAI